MKKNVLIMALLSSIVLLGCGEKTQTESPQAAQTTNAPAAPEAKPEVVENESPVATGHIYTLKDGFEYGYERAISEDAQQQGQAAAKLIMFKYAGEKDGKYQAYAKEDGVTNVIECDKECKYIKVMLFVSGAHAKTERIVGGSGSIASAVMHDAINGHLEQFVVTSKTDSTKKSIWFSEQDGAVLTPLAN